MANHLKKIFIN